MLNKTHWLIQRITAIILIPITMWFFYTMLNFDDFAYSEILLFFSSKINSSLFLFAILIMIYHGKLGVQIIIEDYINSYTLQKKIVIFINLLSYILMIVSILSILSIQLNN